MLGAPVWLPAFSPRAGSPIAHGAARGPLPSAADEVAIAFAPHDLALSLGAPVFTYYKWTGGPSVAPATQLVQFASAPEEAARSVTGTSYLVDGSSLPGSSDCARPGQRRVRDSQNWSQTLGTGPLPGLDLRGIDIRRLASAYGVRLERASSPIDLKNLLNEASLPPSPCESKFPCPAGSEGLDRVLCGESYEAFVAAECGGEAEKGQVVGGLAFVAWAESAVARQP